MPEDVAVPVESSAPAAVAEMPHDVGPIASLTREQRQEWREKGTLPESPEPKKEASAPSSASEKDEKGAPASEAGTDHQDRGQRKPRSAEARLQEVLADIRNAGLTPAELKTFKKQQAAAEASAKDVKPAESSPAPARQELVAPKKPDIKDFATLEEYDLALDKYHEEMTDYKVDKKLAEREQREQMTAVQKQTEEMLAQARTRYENLDAVIVPAAGTLNSDPAIVAPVKAMIGGSPVLADLLYVLSEDPKEFQDFLQLARTQPDNAIRVIVKMESLIEQELSKGKGTKSEDSPAKERDEATGKFTKPTEPGKPLTRVPKPVSEVGGRGTSEEDPGVSAARAGDMRAAKVAWNQQYLARNKA